jgi:hypothetical protein
VRTTVTLDDDVAAAVERLRRQQGMGLSEAVNRLARGGLIVQATQRAPFRQRTVDLGLTVDVDDIGAVLDVLDETP